MKNTNSLFISNTTISSLLTPSKKALIHSIKETNDEE